jgi:predicted Ser/Thr protein kinase
MWRKYSKKDNIQPEAIILKIEVNEMQGGEVIFHEKKMKSKKCKKCCRYGRD